MGSSALREIWLVDDDMDDCDLFEEAIKQILPKSSLVILHNGDQLMEQLPRGKPDLLFLDINMPCKDGLDCLQEIRSRKEFSQLPIVIFSSSSHDEHLKSAYQNGANLYYTKPSSFTNLISGMNELLSMDWKNPSAITSRYFINHKFVPFQFSQKS